MKTCTLPTLAVAAAGLLLTSCDRQAAVGTHAPPALATPPPSVSDSAPIDESAELERQIADLKAQEAALKLEIQEEQLAGEKAELERQRGDFEKDQAEAKALADAAEAASKAGKSTYEPEADGASSSVPSAGESRDYQAFYEGLDEYGDWMETPSYGYVWQPSSTPVGWRPYTLGRWADSDQGWTWISDEPFGWATYHYGRWALLQGSGWIWIPGDTWAPAWVSWRSNDEYVGWCPMPPETVYAVNIDYGSSFDDDYGVSADCYNFIPVRYFDQPVFRYCRPVNECRVYFSRTKCVTNFRVRSGSVFCRGPEVRWVNSCLKAPMKHFRIDRDRSWGGDRRDHRPRFDQDRLAIYSPNVRASWNDGIRPANIRGRLEKEKVVRRSSFKPELEKRFLDQQQDRRQRAVLALKQEPVRQLAERHESLEKLRARRDQPGSRQNDGGRDARPAGPAQVADRSNAGPERDPRPASVSPNASRGAPDKTGASPRDNRPPRAAVVENAGDHGGESPNGRLDEARRELRERQAEVARLRQQRAAPAADPAVAPEKGIPDKATAEQRQRLASLQREREAVEQRLRAAGQPRKSQEERDRQPGRGGNERGGSGTVAGDPSSRSADRDQKAPPTAQAKAEGNPPPESSETRNPRGDKRPADPRARASAENRRPGSPTENQNQEQEQALQQRQAVDPEQRQRQAQAVEQQRQVAEARQQRQQQQAAAAQEQRNQQRQAQNSDDAREQSLPGGRGGDNNQAQARRAAEQQQQREMREQQQRQEQEQAAARQRQAQEEEQQQQQQQAAENQERQRQAARQQQAQEEANERATRQEQANREESSRQEQARQAAEQQQREMRERQQQQQQQAAQEQQQRQFAERQERQRQAAENQERQRQAAENQERQRQAAEQQQQRQRQAAEQQERQRQAAENQERQRQAAEQQQERQRQAAEHQERQRQAAEQQQERQRQAAENQERQRQAAEQQQRQAQEQQRQQREAAERSRNDDNNNRRRNH